MTVSEKHQVTFIWPHIEPSGVIVTGSFDEWSQSIRLQKGQQGFEGAAVINWNEKIAYKFVVDGQWVVNSQEPTETDKSGNVNNVYTAPEKPLEASRTNGTPEELKPAASEIAADFATTMAATDGTSSALEYVASGVGAAIQGVIGLDPVNPDQMSAKSPVSPAPPTPDVIAAFTGEPTSESNHATPSTVPNGVTEVSSVPAPESPKADIASVEPSTHTPLIAPSLPPEQTSVDSAPPAEAEVIPSPSAEASTHTPVVAPTIPFNEPSVDALPVASSTDAATSASAPVEASTHGPVVVPISVPTTPTTDAVIPESVPAVEAITSVAAAEVVVPPVTIPIDTKITSPAEPTTPTKKTHPVNGNRDEKASTPVGSPASSPVPRASTSSILSTPSKRNSRILNFPSRGSPTPESSPSSKFDSASTRSKRKSIFGKMSIKNIFGKDKEKEKEK